MKTFLNTCLHSQNHPTMYKPRACKAGNPEFQYGITRGAAWCPLTGGMKDFNYVWYGESDLKKNFNQFNLYSH
ncbi:unnamed protein product [Nezara viridula]|uniref:Uncharacterized protein n=1 Tax=Nezara viridula TaxID=85310 RepID=A0A9P0HA87_NEZVI|nr:unnamed protein product [Nezara viridula]